MRRASPLAREAVVSAGVAAGFAAVLAWAGPPGTDLAAHVYQRAVFLDHGFTFWNNFWYAGRYSFVTYSIAYYPLAAALGIRLLAVATIALAASAFATPAIIGGRRLKVAATLAYDEFLNTLNWPLGAVVATLLLIALVVAVVTSNRMIERRYAQVFE